MALRSVLSGFMRNLLGNHRHEEANAKSSGDTAQILGDRLDATLQLLGEAPLYNQRGVHLSRAGALVEAEAAFNQAIAELPVYAPAYANRALLYVRLGRHREAVADLRQALEIDPGDERVRRMLRGAEAGNWKEFGI